MKILLVEDEKSLSNVVCKGLKKCGYAVDCALDGEAAIEYYTINAYDLIILDLNLPKVDGIEVLRTIRKENHEIKILILSARDDVEDKIQGLDEGANDYLVKPFDFKELEARIRNLLRRAFVQHAVKIGCQDFIIDLARKIVTHNQITINLTKKEYGILEYLVLNRGRVISAEELIEHVWDSDADLFSNAFKFQLHSLKKKLAQVLGHKETIKNIRGQGYIIENKEV